MISFACAQCGMKFNVKDEFAGRQTTCPTCKHPLTVPQADVTEAYVPPTSIEGPASSLEKASLPGAATLAETGQGNERPVADLLAKRLPNAGRYVIDRELGRGGMGIVLRAIDRDIRREVAVKYLLDNRDPVRQSRFVEEAQITGQLEHPNIVPIHELGVDDKNRPFFSMKVVHGRSLADLLAEARRNPKSEPPLHRLIGILISVCHAMAYAHARNVIHRDLKPGNIMLGDFGEVYVMDWGLAKILTPNQAIIAAVSPTDPSASSTARIETGREADSDLTREGAIVGTPVYMAPEQARGEIHALDARTDIYALGAILYEMLTLKPPVDREGGHDAVLGRVVRGEILPPEQRAPERARIIVPELSAIARKALALNPMKRYRSVQAMCRDLELFLDNRSVSAKDDRAWEMAAKFVKRNKAVSIATGLALVLLTVIGGVSLRINSNARIHAEEQQRKAELAHEDYRQAQFAKETAIRRSLAAFVRAGRHLANEGDLKGAKGQIDLALAYEPRHRESILLKSQLLIAQRDWTRARAELATYLVSYPGDGEARTLHNLAKPGTENDSAVLFDLAAALQRQRLVGLANLLLRDVEQTVAARKKLASLYAKQLDAVWPGTGRILDVLPNGELRFRGRGFKQIADLSPFRGMVLHHLDLGLTPIRNLEPLQGMPLRSLSLDDCKEITDLSPLQGMQLETLDFSSTGVTDLTPLKEMPLQTLDMHFTPVVDLTPLRGRSLRVLRMTHCQQVVSLRGLEGLPLEHLALRGCGALESLAEIRGIPLKSISIDACGKLADIQALEGMPFTTMNLTACKRIRTLEPLKGMPLTELSFDMGHEIPSLEPLRGMKLKVLVCRSKSLESIEPLRGMPLVELDLHECGKVTDLSPLKGMELKRLIFNPQNVKTGMDIVRSMPTLATIGAHPSTPMPAEVFWQRFEKK